MQHPGGGRGAEPPGTAHPGWAVQELRLPTAYLHFWGGFLFFFLLVHHLKGLFYLTEVAAGTPEYATTYLSYRARGTATGMG